MIGKGNDQSSPSIRIFCDVRAEILIVSISDCLKRHHQPAQFEIYFKFDQRRHGEKAQRRVKELISSIRIFYDRWAEIHAYL
jgi:hypothetical protein